MHLPFGRLPKTDADGLIVAAALEKELIRIVQRLVGFFYSEAEAVVQYINECHVELIPHPQFVIAEKRPLSNNGVDGYNNKHPGGQERWQNPIPQTPWRLRQEKHALRVNIVRCAHWIERKGVSPVPCPRAVAVPRTPPPQLPTTSGLEDVRQPGPDCST